MNSAPPRSKVDAGPPPILSRHPLDSGPDPTHDDEDGPDIAPDDPDFPQSKAGKPDDLESNGSRQSQRSTGSVHIVEMPAWKKFLFSYWGAAICLTILSMLLLLIIRPAFLLKRRQNTLEKPKLNPLALFITVLVLFGAYAGIPALIQFCKKRWVDKVR